MKSYRSPIARISALGLSFAMMAGLLGCSSGPVEGALQLVVADQTSENPPRDVVEFRLGDDSTIYPDSAAGGSPTEAGTWTAGETLAVVMWPAGQEEAPVPIAVEIPAETDAKTLSLVIEIEDDEVSARAVELSFAQEFERANPVADQRAVEAKAEADAAEAVRAAEEAARIEAEEQANATVLAIRSEATQLEGEMLDMEDELIEILDEHDTVYGDDDWATFEDIGKKYKDYTTEALADLYEILPNSDFATDEISAANAAWQSWWKEFIQVQSREEVAARNDDTTAMDAIRVDGSELWDRLDELFVLVTSLKSVNESELEG